ncbi:ribonuclease HI [Thiomicrospira sp. WB1]|uniref:ribonuclease HI n=1 Tax=Thiomicrospira sp. WB1 TaxID=1685380 RepID=UPI000747673A|nr:ribonuclease HI [Thiomicrospira sp. WB1]KUJ72963.1 ribonuclease H [Thiomicrospira sp. WB1]
MKKVYLYTDGGCRGNPGPGGWGAVLEYDGHQKCLKGSAPETTNNQMELTAAIRGLEALTRPCDVVLTTDSQYVKNGITQWMANWKRNQWRTAAKKPVKNKALWQALDEAVGRHNVSWHWVKGHAGHPQNELADALANEAMDALLHAD